MALKLPRLQSNLAIVNGQGKPLDYFLRFWDDFAKRVEQSVADINQLIQDIQDQVDRLTAFLNGTGEQVTSGNAFANAVVPTRVVVANAITNEAASYTDGTIPLSGTSETTIQTVSYQTTGQSLEIRANFFLTVWHPAAGDIFVRIRVYRDSTAIFDRNFEAINGDLFQGWQTPTIVEAPPAGTYTFTVTVTSSKSDYDTAEASARLLQVREFKR